MFVAGALLAQAQTKAPEWAERLVREVRSSSFPELLDRDIRVRQFAGSSDYFQALQHLAVPHGTEDALRDTRELGGCAQGCS